MKTIEREFIESYIRMNECYPTIGEIQEYLDGKEEDKVMEKSDFKLSMGDLYERMSYNEREEAEQKYEEMLKNREDTLGSLLERLIFTTMDAFVMGKLGDIFSIGTSVDNIAEKYHIPKFDIANFLFDKLSEEHIVDYSNGKQASAYLRVLLRRTREELIKDLKRIDNVFYGEDILNKALEDEHKVLKDLQYIAYSLVYNNRKGE